MKQQDLFCGGCGENPGEECRDSLSRAQVGKVHWECWSACNLRCGFCYRTKGDPLDTENAFLLLRAIRTGGVTTVVFAGGDPTLRTDLLELVLFARSVGLQTIVHTNGHHPSETFWRAVNHCDHIGVSIDGPNAEVHDGMRGRRGNFGKVIEALERCSAANVPVSVRTVVTAVNAAHVMEIGSILAGFDCVKTWKLLEFSAVEEAFFNKDQFSLPESFFEEVFVKCCAAYPSLHVESLRTAEKIGGYMMISPEGRVYGVTQEESIDRGRHHRIASILTEHLNHLVSSLHIIPENHSKHLNALAGL